MPPKKVHLKESFLANPIWTIGGKSKQKEYIESLPVIDGEIILTPGIMENPQWREERFNPSTAYLDLIWRCFKWEADYQCRRQSSTVWRHFEPGSFMLHKSALHGENKGHYRGKGGWNLSAKTVTVILDALAAKQYIVLEPILSGQMKVATKLIVPKYLEYTNIPDDEIVDATIVDILDQLPPDNVVEIT